jgi:hypothetical protein
MIENQSPMNDQKTIIYISLIVIFGVIISFPSIVYGFPDGGHDSIPHLTWYKQFSEQLWEGKLYPRWLIDENSGLGSPIFFYYPTVTYHISNILRPFFSNDPYGWQQLGMSAVIGLIASGFTSFLWIKSILNEKIAVISAILYMNMPYHVAIDLYERAAISELWAFVWMPLILYFLNKIKKGHKFAIIGMAVSYGLLIMTHLPTTLIFSIIPIAYLFIDIDRKSMRNEIWSTLVAIILGVSLSAIYWLPALSTQGYVNLQRPGIWFLYMDNYLFSQLIPENIFMLELTLILVGMVVLVSCAVFIYLSNSEGKHKQEFIFWFVIGIMSVYMMIPLSQPIVEVFPIIHRIQFPWRFNTILVIATTALVGISIYSLRKPYTRFNMVLIGISALLVISWSGINIWQGIQESTRYDREHVNMRILAGTQEYNVRPQWVQEDIRDFAENVAQVSFDTGVGDVEITRWKPRDIMIRVNTINGAMLNVGQLYYPGWTAQIIGEPCCLLVQPSNSRGLIAISVPGGDHEITLRLLVSTQESVGQLISGASLIITILLGIWFNVSLGRRKPIGINNPIDNCY